MKNTLLLFVLLISFFSYSQTSNLSMIDYVEVLNNNKTEALFYYQNNWEQLRIKAIKQGYIESYNLLETKSTPKTPYSFILITTYKNKALYNASENNFEKLIKQSGGIKLMNHKKPKDFRKVILHNDAVKHWN
ncbi:hypothetical protein [Algibacter sp. PT7-4]|uniref:hypothetical protein n=1 Tax=Algibacter ulvanivorans TaxID=3400999 RepID=UPI003AB0EC4E